MLNDVQRPTGVVLPFVLDPYVGKFPCVFRGTKTLDSDWHSRGSKSRTGNVIQAMAILFWLLVFPDKMITT